MAESRIKVDDGNNIETLNHGHHVDKVEEDKLRSVMLATDHEALGRQYFFSPKFVGSILALSLSVTATYWGFSPPAAILTFINEDIGPSPNSSLFSIIWSMCLPISLLIFGRLSDRFGRRWFFVVSNCIGLIGGIIACTAKNMNTLIVANVFLGLSAGVPTAYGLIGGELVANKYKFYAVISTVVMSLVATGFGAYLSRSLVENTAAGWRWVYYIYLILMVPATLLVYIFYHPPSFRQLHGPDRSRWEEFKTIDFVGLFLLVAGLTLFLLGVSWGGQPSPWNSPKILGLLITGFIVLVILVFWEIYAPLQYPLIPMKYFRDLRGFVCVNIICYVSGIVYIALSIIWPSQVNAIYGTTHTWEQNAWMSTTIGLSLVVGICVIGPFFHKIGHIKYQLILATSVQTAFMGALSSSNPNTATRAIVFSILAMFPNGFLELSSVFLAQFGADDSELGICFAITFGLRNAWGSVFTSVFIAILNSKVPAEMKAHIPPAVIAAGLPESSVPSVFEAIGKGTAAALEAVPGMNSEILVAVQKSLALSYSDAYAYVYYAACAISFVSVIAACCLADYDKYLNAHVPRKVYGRGEKKVDVYLDTKGAAEHEQVV